MTSAFDQALDRPMPRVRPEPAWLHDKRWDRIFIIGGAVLVPIPIILYYVLGSLGVAVGAREDIVTAVVMILVGGPHVFATYTRTVLNPRFRREDRALFIGAFVVASIVIGSVVASAFFDLRILGRPPIQFVLTFFFFWAGVHVLPQNSYFAACYEIRTGGHLNVALLLRYPNSTTSG